MLPPTLPASALSEMTRVKKPQVWCYKIVPLYVRVTGGEFVVFKKPGHTLAESGLPENKLPKQLYLRDCDKHASLPEVQEGLNARLSEALEEGDREKAKALVVDIASETLAQPRAGGLHRLGNTVTTLCAGFANDHGALVQLAMLANNDYSTSLHSVNLAALTLGYCLRNGLPQKETQNLGLAALLHDVGKTQIPREILDAPRRLTDAEFQLIRSHPLVGGRIVAGEPFPPEVHEAVIQHHERLDGSGYPKGIREIAFPARLIGLLDAYEALTSDDRPYRKAMRPIDTLQLLREDVTQGKLDKEIFTNFARTLGS